MRNSALPQGRHSLRVLFHASSYLFAAGLIIGLATAPIAAHAALPAGVTQGASVEGITEYRLTNGLKVLLFPDASQPKTTVNITYEVGSRQESYGETGMAHLLEHMVFKGTPSRGNIMDGLGKRGMDFNGSTSFDRTNYHESFTSSDEDLDWVLAMEADRMVNSFIAKKDLDSEMTVVRNEMESGENDPQNVLWKRVMAAAYDWHNYGKPAIGSRADVEGVDISHLQAFYRTYYQPDNAVLVVAGAFDPDKTLALVAKYFGAIPKPKRVLPNLYTSEPVQDGERQVMLRRPGDTQWLNVLYHTVPGASADYVPLDALGNIMTAAPSGRLYKALVDTKKASALENWVYEGHDPGFAIFFIQVPGQDPIDTARDAALATLESVKTQPITASEVDRVRAKALKGIEEALNNPQQLGIALSEAIGAGDWRLFFINRDRWRALTPADCQRVAEAYFKPSNRTVGEYIPDAKPDRAPEPGTVDVNALVKDYKGTEAVAAGEAFDPTPANLDARAQRFALPNGMKVALLPKKTRGETVRFTIRLRYGDVKSLMGKSYDGQLAVGMLMRGTTHHTRQEIEDTFDKLRAKVSVSGDATAATVRGQTVRANLPDTLRLVAEILREPSFPPAEFATLKRETVAGIAENRADPQSVATRALERFENPYPDDDIRYVATVDSEMANFEKVDIAAVKDFHARFIGASYGQLAVVGDFDLGPTRALATQLFGSWSSPAPYTRVPNPLIVKHPIAMPLETPEKANAFFIAQLALPLNDTSPDFAPMLAANYMLGGGATSRLWNRVRQRDGLSYGVGSMLQTSSFEPNSPQIVYAIFAPENLQKLRDAVNAEIRRALDTGFTDAELAEAKRGLLQERKLARANDGGLADGLAQQAYLGRTFAFSAQVDKAIESLDTATVNATMKKYVKPNDFDIVFAGDFAKNKK